MTATPVAAPATPRLGTVLVTTPSFGAWSDAPIAAAAAEGLHLVRSRFAHPLDAARLTEEIAGADALITGLDEVDGAFLAAAPPSLRVVAKHGVGVDNIDLVAAADRGITVVNAPGANSGAVAELTLGLIVAVARRVPDADASLRRGEWGRFAGPQLHGRRIGLVGLGSIGSRVARLAQAFGMRVCAVDPDVDDARFAALDVTRLPLPELVATSDVISLHLPYLPGDPPLLDAALLRATKPGVVIVNAARGGLLDEVVLAELLVDGHVAGAALDALATEPADLGHPILSAPRTILTPHIGAYSDLANAEMGGAVVRDIARVLRGEVPVHPVLPTGGPTP